MAVNLEGKTNESTNNLKEPLKQGQTKPAETCAELGRSKQVEKQQKEEKPKKTKSKKLS